MAAPLRIIIPLHDFALGGTERIAVRLAGAWTKAGAAVTILCAAPAGPLLALLDPAVAVRTTERGDRGRIGRWRFARAVRAVLRRERPDIVFIPGNFHWPIARAVRRDGHVVIAQVSAALDKPQRTVPRQRLFEAAAQARLARTAAIVTLSEIARGQIDRIVGRPLAHAIPLPALVDDAPPARPVPADPPLIVAAGRLVPEKGFATLIAAFARLSDGAARLRIVGDGPDAGRLRAIAREAGVGDRVELPGYTPDIRSDLDAARLFVLASDFEGFPAVLVEALAAGRPVVATDCTPATALLADPGAGCVVPIGDAAAMAAAIDAMLATPPPDPATLAASVASHRIGAVAGAYLALFDRLRAR